MQLCRPDHEPHADLAPSWEGCDRLGVDTPFSDVGDPDPPSGECVPEGLSEVGESIGCPNLLPLRNRTPALDLTTLVSGKDMPFYQDTSCVSSCVFMLTGALIRAEAAMKLRPITADHTGQAATLI